MRPRANNETVFLVLKGTSSTEFNRSKFNINEDIFSFRLQQDRHCHRCHHQPEAFQRRN